MSRIVVVSGPSGVGKGTLIKVLHERFEGARVTVSDTTRPIRPHEVEGESYNFISVDEFKRRIESGYYVEWEYFFETYYGTPKSELDALGSGESVLLELDPNGALSIRREYPNAALIFVLPGSVRQLVERLIGRGTETETQLSSRLSRINEELNMASNFDFAVINDDLKQASEDISDLFNSLRFRIDNFELAISKLRQEAVVNK